MLLGRGATPASFHIRQRNNENWVFNTSLYNTYASWAAKTCRERKQGAGNNYIKIRRREKSLLEKQNTGLRHRRGRISLPRLWGVLCAKRSYMHMYHILP